MADDKKYNPNKFSEDESSATAAKRERDARLRDAGLPIERTKNELLDEIDDAYGNNPNSAEAERLFLEGLTSGDPLSAFRKVGEVAQQGEEEKNKRLAPLLDEYYDRYGGEKGRVFRPSVLQEPSEKSLFNSTEEAALGPAPDLLFRDVFKENFGDLASKTSPYDKFVASKEKDLQSKFMTDIFRQFNEPGFVDGLKADYEKLYRQKELGDFNGSGGSIPDFTSYIQGKVKGDYRTFLQAEASPDKLKQAFQLTAPKERGQKDEASIASKNRIL